MDTTLDLNCLIKITGQTDADYIQVTVPHKALLHTVRQIVHGVLRAHFERRKISVVELALYKLQGLKLRDLKYENQFMERVDACINGQVPLAIVDEIQDVFSEGELKDDSLFHLVVVEKPWISTVVPAKRPLEDEDDTDYFQSNNIDHIENNKFANTPASLIARTTYKILQLNHNERILDDRPTPDPDIPPISLLYSGFGRFLDIFEGREDFLGTVDPKASRNLQLAVDGFADLMAGFYGFESPKANKGRCALDAIFESLFGCEKFPKVLEMTVDKQRMGGCFMGAHDAPLIVVEFKNEIADNTGQPNAQVASYVAHSYKEASKRHKELFIKRNAPCLGMSIMGPFVIFHAIIYIGRFRVVDLSDALNCVESTRGSNSRNTLYNAFAAACVLLDCIQEDVKKYMTTSLPEQPHYKRNFPYICKLPRYPPGSQGSDLISFQICDFHAKHEGRLIFRASTDNGDIIVKFVRQYSLELHEFCANRGHAPKIIGYKDDIPGGWRAIAMEYVATDDYFSTRKDFFKHGAERASELRSLVDSFHQEGFVHGDLREPNILYDDTRVLLIDFDWGGKEGEAYYPSYKLNDELICDRECKGLKITKQDDIRVLNNTLQWIGSNLYMY